MSLVFGHYVYETTKDMVIIELYDTKEIIILTVLQTNSSYRTKYKKWRKNIRNFEYPLKFIVYIWTNKEIISIKLTKLHKILLMNYYIILLI